MYLYQKYSGNNNESDTYPSSVPSFAPSRVLINPSASPSVEATPFELPLLEIVIGLFFLSMLSFATFLSLINEDYWVTFYSTQTGKQFLCDNWRNGKTDKERFYIFSKHKSYYKSINKEIMIWLRENWEKWEEDKDEWFTAKMISKIPNELLPPKVLQQMGGARGRRKSSAAAISAEDLEKRLSERKLSEKKASARSSARASASQVLPLG